MLLYSKTYLMRDSESLSDTTCSTSTTLFSPQAQSTSLGTHGRIWTIDYTLGSRNECLPEIKEYVCWGFFCSSKFTDDHFQHKVSFKHRQQQQHHSQITV
jgi:hypothetical protein